ncbi:MAG: hypothetical protein DHS20C20_20930 [Ardenticatenaceae bacterium]|nr:MAG: hypothetical protein DHS20C20_20930 [Ardenticatenaceae bacterium]
MADVSIAVNSPQKLLNSKHLEQVLYQVSGVTAVHIEAGTSRATVSYKSHMADTYSLVTAVYDAGYSVVTESITLFVGGMTCPSCAFHLESALTDLPGVIEADVDLQTGTTTVIIAAEEVALMVLYEAVQEAGYQICEPIFGS